MPNDPGPTSWDPKEYERALRNIQSAGEANAARLARARTMVRVDDAGNPTIRVPEWRDVVRVGPRPIVTPEDRAIARDFKRRGLPSPLAPEVQAELDRRNEVAKHIRDNPVPEYQRSVATVVTAVDNLNDAAVTASVAGNVAMPFLGRFGTWLAPAVSALGAIATFLNWIAWAVIAWGVAYAYVCQGPRAAAAAVSGQALGNAFFKSLRLVMPRRSGIANPRTGRDRKAGVAAMHAGIPDGRRATTAGMSRWARARPSFAEALQVAQTAYDVTGYGLSLGALYGFTAETTYTATRIKRGSPGEPRSPRVNHELQSILAPHVEILSDAALWHREQCCRAIAAAPLVLRDPDFFGDELYALTWLTFYVSLEPLMWDTFGVSWRETVISGLPAAWRPWDVRDLVSRDALRDAGIDPDAPRTWPIPGNPYELDSDRLVLEIGPEIGAALRRWLYAAPSDPLRRFVAELSIHVCERVWYFLEASPYVPTWELSPTSAVWESITMADRWPVISDDADAMMAAFRDCENYVETTGRKYIDVEVLDRIWADRGVPLLRIVGDGSSDLREFLQPYDPKTGAPAETAAGTTVAEARERLARLLDAERPKY